MIDQTECAPFSGDLSVPAIGWHCSLEILWICQIHYNHALVRRRSSSGECLLPKISYRDHVVGESAGHGLLQLNKPHRQTVQRFFESRAIKFWHQIVDVQDDSTAGQTRENGRKNQEVRQIVNLNDIEALLHVKTRHSQKR